MRTLQQILVTAAIAASALTLAPTVQAEEVKMVGTIVKIQMAPGGKSATAILKDNKSGQSVTITITDDLTLDKFKDKRIVEGDEIRTKFDKKGDINESQSFKKTAGC